MAGVNPGRVPVYTAPRRRQTYRAQQRACKRRDRNCNCGNHSFLHVWTPPGGCTTSATGTSTIRRVLQLRLDHRKQTLRNDGGGEPARNAQQGIDHRKSNSNWGVSVVCGKAWTMGICLLRDERDVDDLDGLQLRRVRSFLQSIMSTMSQLSFGYITAVMLNIICLPTQEHTRGALSPAIPAIELSLQLSFWSIKAMMPSIMGLQTGREQREVHCNWLYQP